VLGVIAVFGVSAAVLGIVSRRPAVAVGEQRYSALLLHESQKFDQDWELTNGTAPFASSLKYRTQSWVYTEVIVENPHSVPVPFCWRVTQPSLIGTQDCTGTIPANGVVVFDSYTLESTGKLVGPKGILEIETAGNAPELVVWQHQNKHSTGQLTFVSSTVMGLAYFGRARNFTTSGLYVDSHGVPPIGSGASIAVERVFPVLAQ